MAHFCPITRNNKADFVTDFEADCVTDFCIFSSYNSVGKSFGVTYALRLLILVASVENNHSSISGLPLLLGSLIQSI